MKHSHSLYLSTEIGAEGYLCLYERIISYLIEDYTVIYAVESNTNIVIRRLSILDNNRILNFIQNHALVVADPAYPYTEADLKLLSFLQYKRYIVKQPLPSRLW
jgi:hypothetical protein